MATTYTPTPSDVLDSYEEDTANVSDTYLSKKIDEAVIVLASKVGDLSTYPADMVKMLLVRAVLRVVRNPAGFEAEAEGTYNYNLSARTGSGTIWFPDDELAMLIPPTVGVGSIRTSVPYRRRGL